MKISELLRIFADTLDRIVDTQQEPSQPQYSNTPVVVQPTQISQPAKIAVQPKVDDDEESLGDFIPPLQQKLELLKKAVDVPNYYDENSDSDELTAMKKNAGLNVEILDQLTDNDLLSE